MARRWPATAVLACALGGALACETQVPAPVAGGIIRGEIHYRGEAHARFGRPALQIAALAVLPPPGRPHAAMLIDRPDLSKPVPYQLGNLPPFKYKVVARLTDGADPKVDMNRLPTGSFPSFCALVEVPGGNVDVTAAAPTTGVDITLFDNGGAADPCNLPKLDVCPVPGASSLVTVLELSRPKETIKYPDQLIFAVLEDAKSLPVRFKLLSAADLEAGFPLTIVLNDLPPGSYIVYACYDVGGNSLFGCGPEDFSAMYSEDAKLTVEPRKITNVRLNLDAHTVTSAGTEDPAAHKCM